MVRSFTIFSIICISVFHLHAQNWNIDNINSAISFTSDHANGEFKKIDGTIILNPKSVEKSTVNLSIPVSSIYFENETQTSHAIGPKWLDEANFGHITFKSTEIKANIDDFLAIGILSIYGVEKEVSIPFSFVEKGKTGLFTGETDINRSDFGFGGDTEKISKINVIIKIAVTK